MSNGNWKGLNHNRDNANRHMKSAWYEIKIKCSRKLFYEEESSQKRITG